MSKSSFYHYFANKTELFQQIFAQTLAPIAHIAAAFQPELLTKVTFWPSILSSSQGGSKVFTSHPEIFEVGRMFHRNMNEPNGICREIMQAHLGLISRIIERGKEIGTIRDDLPTSLLIEAAVGLGMAIDRWAIENANSFEEDDFGAFTEKSVGMFVKVLSPET